MEYDGHGAPVKGFIIGRLVGGQSKRFVANAGSSRALELLASRVKEPIGRVGWVKTDESGRNLFEFDQAASL